VAVKAFYFDAGASLYTSGAGGASQKWFVDEFARHGIRFGRIFGWDSQVYPPAKLWSEVPAEVKPLLAYYNIPINPSADSPDNILNYIRAFTTPEDYVDVKIDVDNTEVEMALISQILQSKQLQSLVDELFWEHHVRMSPMFYRGWFGQLQGTSLVNNTLDHSYTLFSALRKAGIRAHSWV
jgi:hypothetical protein